MAPHGARFALDRITDRVGVQQVACGHLEEISFDRHVHFALEKIVGNLERVKTVEPL